MKKKKRKKKKILYRKANERREMYITDKRDYRALFADVTLTKRRRYLLFAYNHAHFSRFSTGRFQYRQIITLASE